MAYDRKGGVADQTFETKEIWRRSQFSKDCEATEALVESFCKANFRESCECLSAAQELEAPDDTYRLRECQSLWSVAARVIHGRAPTSPNKDFIKRN